MARLTASVDLPRLPYSPTAEDREEWQRLSVLRLAEAFQSMLAGVMEVADAESFQTVPTSGTTPTARWALER